MKRRTILTLVTRSGASHSQDIAIADFIEFIDLLRVHCASETALHTSLLAALNHVRAPWGRVAIRALVAGRSPWTELASIATSRIVRDCCTVLDVVWGLAQNQGVSPTGFLEHVRNMCRVQQETQALIREETSALVMSARLLTGLPLLSLPLGLLIGAHPLTWLLGTAPGRVVFVVGLSMNITAWRAHRRIITRATRIDEHAQSMAVSAAALTAIASKPETQPVELAQACRQLTRLDTSGTLAQFVTNLDIGLTTEQAWLQASAGKPHWQTLGKAMAEMSRTGVLLPQLLGALSEDASQSTRAALRERVRKSAVLILLPTGLLALPAFMLLTVVPLVASSLTHTPWLTNR